jgi:hypothetical protein
MSCDLVQDLAILALLRFAGVASASLSCFEAGHLARLLYPFIALFEREHAMADHDSVDFDIHSICPDGE